MQKANGTGNKEIKGLIFDMDNTLFDFVEAKLKACKAAVNHVDRTDDLELIEYFLRSPDDVEDLGSISRYLTDRSIYTEEVFKQCCEIYESVKIENIFAYDGVKDTLGKLKTNGLKLAVVTDAFEKNAQARLNKTELSAYFDFVVTGEATGTKKPDPEPILLALNLLALEPQECMMIGDSLRRDIEPGKRLGMVTVYAKYGDRNFFETQKQTGAADHVINELSEVLGILGVDG